jgi:DNA modification methylase
MNLTDVNIIHNEDCIDTMDKMPNSFVDVILTSPPLIIQVEREVV